VPELDTAQWLGPLGGLLCVTFAAGCVAGWTFAMKLMNARIASMKQEITDLKRQVGRLNDFLLRATERQLEHAGGMSRQLGQVRESSYRQFIDGEEREEEA
jgi:hypothetical protein